ncbi:MAG: hypothetical protein HQ553_02535 [Chloroflexi bacterium]|nr:hypothetical protein [Chloroflexota bacterium]
MESNRISSLAVAIVLLLVTMPGIVLAATEIPSTGSFTIPNEDPSITSVELWSTGTGAAQATLMSPQTQYNVKVAATDNNTFNDLNTLKVTIYYDADGTYDEGDRPGTGNTQSCAILTWTNGGSFTIDPSASTTWAVVSGSCSAPSLTSSTGTFEFHFKPGKVATENNGNDEWHIYAIATDGAAGTGDNYQEDREMNWYGEVSGVTATTSFGTVPLGCSGSVSGAVSATYISNGPYDEQVRSDATMTGQDSAATLTLHTSGTSPGASQFALKADDDDTVADSVQVQSDYYTTINNSGTQTGEAGITQANNHLWLWLYESGIISEEYQGTLYYRIINGL